jgi:hypothetical protein
VRDWRAIARACGLEIPAKDFERIGPPLDALEESFRPLTRDLAPDLEPAVDFRVEDDSQ